MLLYLMSNENSHCLNILNSFIKEQFFKEHLALVGHLNFPVKIQIMFELVP